MIEAIHAFAARVFDEICADPSAYEPNMRPVTVEAGRKYARLVRNGSVWCFVEIATGDIYKAAGWKGPAKHVRGNIATATYGREYHWTGPAYLR